LHGSYVRDRLAIILAKLSRRLHSQVYEKENSLCKKKYDLFFVFFLSVENRLLPVFKNFINDTNADIRTLACKKLPILAQSLE
jgi:hypothetical protein